MALSYEKLNEIFTGYGLKLGEEQTRKCYDALEGYYKETPCKKKGSGYMMYEYKPQEVVYYNIKNDDIKVKYTGGKKKEKKLYVIINDNTGQKYYILDWFVKENEKHNFHIFPYKTDKVSVELNMIMKDNELYENIKDINDYFNETKKFKNYTIKNIKPNIKNKRLEIIF
jgi:hypothetical protein